MSSKPVVSPEAFQAMQNVDIDAIVKLGEKKLRVLLPCLVRMSLCAPLDTSNIWVQGRKKLLRVLSGLEVVNSIVALLSVDFSTLEQDALKEAKMRQKLGDAENHLTAHIQHGLALEFEKSDSARRLRLLISELLFISSQIKEPTDFTPRTCELFENEVYREEVSDVLCIAQAELPSLLPVNRLAEVLLRVKLGPTMLCRLVANIPDSFFQVCNVLIKSGERQDEDSIGGRRRTESLRLLAAMNPSQTLKLRALAVEQCRLPGLAVALSLDHAVRSKAAGGQGDMVSFLSGLLLGSSSTVRNWFAQFVRSSQKLKQENTMLQCLRDHLLQELKSITPSKEHFRDLPARNVVQASAFMRLYCALKGIAGMKFSEIETKQLLRLLTSHPPPTAAGIRFISMGLCMLLACPFLVSVDDEKIVTQWINWLVKEGPRFETESGVSASFSEMLLLMAIHFHANQMQAIVDLVCTTLGMKIAMRTNSLAKMRLLFIQDIFTEQVAAAHAVTVAVTPKLSASTTGFLPVHCVFHLLKSRAFTKHNIPIKDWLFRQICNATPPLHPLLPPLIEVFVTSVVMPTQSGSKHLRNAPLSEREILSVFKSSAVSFVSGSEAMEVDEKTEIGEEERMTAQLLMLYYVLLYEDCVLNNMKHLMIINERPLTYSSQLISQLPIKYLVRHAQTKQTEYGALYPILLRCVSTHYPHLCLVEEWLADEVEERTRQRTRKRKIGGRRAVRENCTPEELKKALSMVLTNPTPAVLILESLLDRDNPQLMEYSDTLVASLLGLLDPQVPRKVTSMAVSLWHKLNTVMPRKLHVMTVNALGETAPVTPFSEEDLTLDPLIVLRCDLRVFRCPPVLELVLQTLRAYLAACRAYLSSHILSNPTVARARPDTSSPTALPSQLEREELKAALLITQESAAMQILLEICMPFDNEKVEESRLSCLREIQCQVCSLLHQMFIADPNLAKLIHFQGYASELLPVTVAGVPSMHICLDFIPELLAQPDMAKQVFAIELTSHLCLQYALPKSLSVARLAINVMSSLLTVLTGERWAIFYKATLPSIVRICRAFPPLYEDITSILVQLGRVCASRIATAGNSPDYIGSDAELAQMMSTGGQAASALRSNEKNSDRVLLKSVEDTFAEIVRLAILQKDCEA
ncbi:integrator complex subunit 2 [Strongylocentrotus purpuratus]|uniref:Integrator complex subunit 2 n=1 Tax=Strongylocentrotus purpuratus TaxID=7668 RepID=A0A7M7P7A8_STRPU|nr:integrator complex subunit 2 [Strongylocentrotus purpuratus]